MNGSAELVVAVVGLGFGAEFVPIHLSHPDVATVVLVDPDADRRAAVAAAYGVGPGHGDLAAALADPAIDAVHLLAPVAHHADLTIAALSAGKHVLCAVPLATSLTDLDRVIAAQEASGLVCSMAETTVFAREFFAVQDMLAAGELGEPTLYRGYHVQNLDGFPHYWQGFPPMHYATHALSPALALLDTTVAAVQCRGAGQLTRDRRRGGFDNPFPTEIGLFTLHGSDVLVQAQVSFFQTARSYLEGFSLYGSRRGVEWPADNEGPLTVFDMTDPAPGRRGNPVTVSSLDPPDHPDRLPPPLRRFVRPSTVALPGMPAPVAVPAHHGGSHPFLVDDFVRSIVDGRPPLVDARRAAAWTAPGICAHASALADGERVPVSDYLGGR